MVCRNGDLRHVHRGHGVRRDRQAVPRRQHRLHDGRARLHGDGQQAERHECGTGMVCQGGRARPARRVARARRRTSATTGRWSARAPRRLATTANTNVAGGHHLRHGHGVQRDRRLRGVCRRHDLRCSGQALQPGDDRLQHRHAGLHRSGQPTERDACGSDMVCSNGNCAACSVGTAASPRILATPASPSARRRSAARTPATRSPTAPLAEPIGCATPERARAAPRAPAASRPIPARRARRRARPAHRSAWSRATGPAARCAAPTWCATTGTCVTCQANSACPPANPCHTGTLTCSTGAPVCTDSGQSVADGTACGANLVCRTGNCVACVANQPCQPTNPCKNGATSCATGLSVCVETTNKGAGTLCGAGQSCAGGC